MPTGIYATLGYREFTLSSVSLAPVNIIITFIQNFIGLGTLVNSFSISNFYALLFVIVFCTITIILRNSKIEQFSNNKWMLYVGLYLFIAGAFAYIVVGLPPLFDGYHSRHQILLRFGSAFLLTYLVGLIISARQQKFIVTFILTLFLVSTISSQLQFQKSWFKQMALEEEFSNEILLGEGVNFVVLDNTQEYNEFKYNEGYRFYCYTGILMKTFGTQTRFAIDLRDLDSFTKKYKLQDFIGATYLTKDCNNITSFSYIVIVNKGDLYLSDTKNLRLLFQYYFNKEEFNYSLKKILSLNIIPYDTKNI